MGKIKELYNVIKSLLLSKKEITKGVKIEMFKLIMTYGSKS